MKKALCLLITALILISAITMTVSASSSADAVIENLSAFNEKFNVTTNSITDDFSDAFIKKPELVFYYNGMSCTIFNNRADCNVQYTNTKVAINDISVAKSLDDFYEILRTAMMNAQTNVNIVLTDGKNQDADFAVLIERIHERDYIAYMGYNSVSVHKFSNKYSDAVAYRIEFTYGYDSAALIEMKKQTRAEVTRLAAEIFKQDMSEYMLVKSIHDYLIDKTKYSQNESDPMVYYAYGPLMKGRGTCEGYAEAARLLFTAVGIESLFISGTVENNSPHAWNIIKIGGNYYHIDITWDDPIVTGGGDVKNYDYFNITDAEIAADHVWSGNYPKCTATDKGVGATQTAVRPQSQQTSSVTTNPASSVSQKTSSAVSSKPSQPLVVSPAPQSSSQTVGTDSSLGAASETLVSPDLPVFSMVTSTPEVESSSSFDLSETISTIAETLGLSVALVTTALFIILAAVVILIIYSIFKRNA